MATEPTLRDRLEAVRSLRKLARALAVDPRSTKDMEAWRRALTRWKAGLGIDEENAVIVADHLEGRPTWESLLPARPEPAPGALALIAALEERVAALEALVRVSQSEQPEP